MNQVFKIVTDRILDSLRKGVVPWKRSWDSVPKNFVTKNNYQGVNSLLLLQGALEWGSPYFLTENQGKLLGWTLKAGQKPYVVVFYTTWIPKDSDPLGEPEERWVLRYYGVFNVLQFEGSEDTVVPDEFSDQEPSNSRVTYENYISREKINTKVGNSSYSPRTDTISLPLPTLFKNPDDYYVEAFHEAVHSTGIERRLNRFKTDKRQLGVETYSREELVAEIGANFLCNLTGAKGFNQDNSDSYIKGWLKFLADHPKEIVFAASQGQKAAEFIMGREWNSQVRATS
jgi:antirestriction protein ArdC